MNNNNDNGNKWVVDRTYGSGMALGFVGDPDFIRRSTNFAINFLVHDASKITVQTPRFSTLNTSEERLRDALYREAYAQEMLKLAAGDRSPLSTMEAEDFPEGFDERLEEFSRKLMLAGTPEEVAEVMKSDPTAIFEEKTPIDREVIADVRAKARVEEQMQALVSEEFMRSLAGFGLEVHQVAERA